MSPKAVKRIRLLAAWAGLFLLAALAGAGWFYSRLRASLPRLDGVQRISGLAEPVTIERDALGVPTIRAATREDIAGGRSPDSRLDRPEPKWTSNLRRCRLRTGVDCCALSP